MIDPLTAARITLLAYDPGFVASGMVPDLSAFGCTDVQAVYGNEAGACWPYGLLATMPDGGQVIALRGTDNLDDAITDANIRLVPNLAGRPGRVHCGFLAVTDSLGVGPHRMPFSRFITSLNGLTLCGHSLGGAYARQLSIQFGRVGQLLTWGEPRSCDATAATYAETCTAINRRAVNPHDAVPLVPVLDLLAPLNPYRHVGEAFDLRPAGIALSAHALTTYIALEESISGNP